MIECVKSENAKRRDLSLNAYRALVQRKLTTLYGKNQRLAPCCTSACAHTFSTDAPKRENAASKQKIWQVQSVKSNVNYKS